MDDANGLSEPGNGALKSKT